MKVFTVGLDEKPPMKDAEKGLESPGPLPGTPPPIITLEKKNPDSCKRYLWCMLTVLTALLVALIFSELAYNRARDENYLSLRWAELRQRMAMNMGWDNSYNNNYNLQPQPQPLVQQIYRPDRVDSAAYIQESTTYEAPTTTTPPPTTPVEVANPDDGLPGDEANPSAADPRLQFLRKILSKIREEAEKAGIDGTMQVSVMRVDQPDFSQVQEPSFADGFGEIQQPFIAPSSPLDMFPMPKMFGPWPSEEFYNNNDDNRPVSNPMMMGQPMDMQMPSMMFSGRPMMMMNQAGNSGPMMMNSGPMPHPFSALPFLFMGARRFDQSMLPTSNLAGSFDPRFNGPVAAPAQPQIQPQIIPQEQQPQPFGPRQADAPWNINDTPQQMQQQIPQVQPQLSSVFISPLSMMQVEAPQQDQIPIVGPQLPQSQQPQMEPAVQMNDQLPMWFGRQFPMNEAPPSPQSLSRELWTPNPKNNIADNFDQRMNGALLRPLQMSEFPQNPQSQQPWWNPDLSWINNEIREQPNVQFQSYDGSFKPADGEFSFPSVPVQFQPKQQQLPVIPEQADPEQAIEQSQPQAQAQQTEEAQFVHLPEVRPIVPQVLPIAAQREQSPQIVQEQQEQQPLMIPTVIENNWQKPQPIVPVNGDQSEELVEVMNAANRMEMQEPRNIPIISPRITDSIPFFQSKLDQEKIEMPIEPQQAVDDAPLRIDQKPSVMNPIFLQVDEPGRFDDDTMNVME